MSNTEDQEIKDFEKLNMDVPEEMRRALYWMINNMNYAHEFAEQPHMTDVESDEAIRKALEKKDYLLLSLLLYKQCRDESGENTRTASESDISGSVQE